MSTLKEIVIIDDDVAICQVLQLLLSDIAKITYFHDVDSANEYLKDNSENIKLLILDFNIGKQSGIDFYKQNVIAKGMDIPAVLISGFIVTQLKTAPELLELNELFVKVFEKPFDFVEFKSFLETTIFTS
jgi:DNA-binding NtrC family response regulator